MTYKYIMIYTQLLFWFLRTKVERSDPFTFSAATLAATFEVRVS